LAVIIGRKCNVRSIFARRKSARGLAQSKTLARILLLCRHAQCLGLRRPSAALGAKYEHATARFDHFRVHALTPPGIFTGATAVKNK
jgi:hypothetical protein